MTLLLFCEEFCRIKFLNMFKIFATTLRHMRGNYESLAALRPTRDVCRQLSQNSRSPVR